MSARQQLYVPGHLRPATGGVPCRRGVRQRPGRMAERQVGAAVGPLVGAVAAADHTQVQSRSSKPLSTMNFEEWAMGLDITAYSKLEPVGLHYEGSWCETQYDDETCDRVHVPAFAYDCFPQSFRGLPNLGTKSGISGESSFIEGGYNAWRNDLRMQFNPNTEPGKPFYELIWFADNEGTIGPEAAADLLADFLEHAERYAPGQYEDWFRDKYTDWTTAFELAVDGGLVEFH